jgi:shikimate dehydrogenase
VHTTPLGSLQHPGGLAVTAESLRPGTLVLDAVYNPIRTPLLLAAKERGCTAVPGGEWFVRQAIAQFRLFTNSEPDEALMRKSFEHAHSEAGGRGR